MSWADISAKLSPVCPAIAAKRNANSLLYCVLNLWQINLIWFDLIWFDYSKAASYTHLEFCPHIYVGPNITPTFSVLQTPLSVQPNSLNTPKSAFLFSHMHPTPWRYSNSIILLGKNRSWMTERGCIRLTSFVCNFSLPFLFTRKRGSMFSPALVCVSVCVSVCLCVCLWSR